MISLPLLKFSWATDPDAELEKYSWQHTVHNLHVVFDTFRGSVPSSTNGPAPTAMKVTQGSQILECVDLDEKLRDAHDIIEKACKYGIEMRGDQLPISALVRSPLLAIRYSLPDKQIRRIQLKFSSDSDFQIVHSFLDRLGCRITTSSTTTTKIAPSCPPSSLAALNMAQGNHYREEISSGPSNTVDHMTQAMPHPQGASSQACIMQPGTIHQALQSQSSLTTNYLNDKQMNGHHRQEIQVRHTIPMSTENKEPLGPSAGLTSTHDQNYGMKTASSGYEYHDNSLQRPTTSPTMAPSDIPSINPRSAQWHGSTATYNGVASSPFPSTFRSPHFPLPTSISRDTSVDQRPSTAPTGLHDSLSQIIPPRRELPFRKVSLPLKDQKVVEGARSSSRPSSSTALPPLPSPTYASSTSSTKAAKQPSNRQKNNRPSKRQPTGRATTKTGGHSDPTPIPPPIVSSSTMPFHSSSPLKRPFSVIDLTTTATQPLPQDNNDHHFTSTIQTDPRQDVSGGEEGAPDSPTAESINRITSILAQALSNEKPENLTAYASQPAEERAALLNEWMISHLEDESFATLCEDVWGCWRRIALGL